MSEKIQEILSVYESMGATLYELVQLDMRVDK